MPLDVINVVFAIGFLGSAYAFVGYPLLAFLRAKIFGRPIAKGDFAGTYSIVIAVHNEEANIERRLMELTSRIDPVRGDIVVATDGCVDRTVEIVRAFQTRPEGAKVSLVELPTNRGKAAALSEAAAKAQGEILLFADARQTWAEDTIAQLLSNFADRDVGAVSGDLRLETSPGVLAGVGLYWRFEKWLRMCESRTWSQVGVTGAVSGVRRELFSPIPAGTLLDDVYWPLRVAMTGRRVVHDESAKAFDRLPPKSSAEFRRKVRTLAGNYQLAAMLPGSLLPWRNPVWLAWVSHKLMRLAAPWLLLGMLVTSPGILPPWGMAFFGVQLAGYSLGVLGMIPSLGRSRALGAAASFVVLNAAAAASLIVWMTGRAGSSWKKVDYAAAES